jgi:acyl-CoA dehydrogenase
MLYIVLAVVALGLLIHLRAKIPVWTAYFALVFWYLTYAFAVPGKTALWVSIALFLAAAAAVNVPGIRRFLFIRPLLLLFRRKLPPLSQTEREALEAGTVWWEGELFAGTPDWRKLLAMPEPTLTEEERFFLDNTVEELCRLLDDYQIAEDHDLPPEVWQFIRRKGFFGMIIPKEYGGLGFSTLAHSQVVVKIASRSITAAVTVMVPNSLGPAELLLHYGTAEQKQHYLPRLARGEEIPCLALTGPEAGSDAASIPDTGVVCRANFRGGEITGIRLNWEKRYITLGPVATLLGLAFRLHDPERLLGGDENPGITLALIPTGTPGITIGSRHNPLGVPFQNGPNWGKDVFIPLEWVVGGRAGIGRGWQMIMESLAAGRSVSMPALSIGVGKFTALAVGAYAGVRRQFRLPIGRFEGIEEALAQIAGKVYVMDAARVVTCSAVDAGEKPSVISAIIKYYCTEQMRKVVNDGMDILGGSGICLGPSNVLGRIYQAAPIGITVEGANILTRSMIIFGQGVIRCHPYLLKEMHAALHPDIRRGLSDFDRLLGRHTAFVLRNALHAVLSGLAGARLTGSPDAAGRCYYRAAGRFSAGFALTTDFVMLMLGGELKRRERISARLADVLIHLYLISALLKRFKDTKSPREELPLLQWGCETCLHAIQESFMELFDNLPSRPVAWLLRRMVFPLGRSFHSPSDRLCSRIAGILTDPTKLRDRVSEGIFIPADISDPFGRLEDALKKAKAAEPIERKLRNAVREGKLEKQTGDLPVGAGVLEGIITEDEAEIVRQAAAARRKVIRVDDFPHL